MERSNEERSIPQLLSHLTTEISDLVRKEVALARAEISEKITQVETGVVSLAAGGVVAFAGFLILLVAAVLGLANWVSPWLSALIVGGVVTLIGLAMLMKGRSNMKTGNLAPTRTARSVQQDAELAKAEVKR